MRSLEQLFFAKAAAVDEREETQISFSVATTHEKKCLISRRRKKCIQADGIAMMSVEMIWEAKGRKMKSFSQRMCGGYFLHQDFFRARDFSASFPPLMQYCITQKMIAVHNEHNDDDVNHVVCVCLYTRAKTRKGCQFQRRFFNFNKYLMLDDAVQGVLCINNKFFHIIKRAKGKACLDVQGSRICFRN